MLGVDQQPIVSAVGQLFGDGGAVRVEEQAHLGLSGAQLFFEFRSAECGIRHVFSSWDMNCVVYRMRLESWRLAGKLFRAMTVGQNCEARSSISDFGLQSADFRLETSAWA